MDEIETGLIGGSRVAKQVEYSRSIHRSTISLEC